MTDEPKVTIDGQRLIEAWIAAKDSLEMAKSQVNRAECDFLNARNALGKWLLPEDAKPGEKIGVWFGDSLIQAEVVTDRDPVVTIRKRGRSLRSVA